MGGFFFFGFVLFESFKRDKWNHWEGGIIAWGRWRFCNLEVYSSSLYPERSHMVGVWGAVEVNNQCTVEEGGRASEKTSCILKLAIYGWNEGKNVEWKRERSASEIHFQCSQYDGIFWNSNDMPIRFWANNMQAWNTRKFPPDQRAEMLQEENENGNRAHQCAQIWCQMSVFLKQTTVNHGG